MSNPAEQWFTIDGNAVGREELWDQYAPLFRERLADYTPYRISYSLLVPVDSTTAKERRFLEHCLPILPIQHGNGVFARLQYELSPQQMELLLHRLWIEVGLLDSEEEDCLFHWLSSILETLNISLI